jgi:hypothetical protein
MGILKLESFGTLTLLLILALVGSLGMDASAQKADKGEGGQLRVYPKQSDKYLINPGKGWIVYESFRHASEAAWEKASVGYARFNWKDIHTADGTFQWEPIDSALKECRKRGKRFAFGIMAVCVNSKENWVGMPDWVVAAGAKWYPSETAPACKVPVWEDPVFMAKMGQLVSALAERYNGNPAIEFIDCRTFGNWGEWHLVMLGGKDPGDAVKRKFVDQWAGFDKTHVVLPISAGSGMNPGGYGFYARDKYGFAAREDSAEHPPQWKTCAPFLDHGPAIAEWSWPYGKIKYGQGWTGKKWQDEMLPGQMLGSRYSYQPLGEWNSPNNGDADLFLAEKGRLVDEWQNRMGYWFRMTEASYPGDFANGNAGKVTFGIRNDGVAPIYLKGHSGVVKAALMDADNRVLAVATLKGVNPFGWKAAQTVTNTAEIAFPRHKQAAKIALGVFSSEGAAHPDIKLGIENGTEQNWYVLPDMPPKRAEPAAVNEKLDNVLRL